jgi:hypothetical protein
MVTATWSSLLPDPTAAESIYPLRGNPRHISDILPLVLARLSVDSQDAASAGCARLSDLATDRALDNA